MKKIETDTEEYKFAPSRGSTLNMACSNKINESFPIGRIVNIVGDSSSGKSFVAITALAEIARAKNFDNYQLIYDDVEAACDFDMEYLFSPKIASRIDMVESSDTVEDFFYRIVQLLNQDTPFVYVLDSLDALDTDKEEKKTMATLEARANGKNIAGDYGMQKPKMMSHLFRTIKKKIKQTNSMLIIVSQTRADINPMTFSKTTRSGGKALEFYSTIVMWLAKIKSIQKTVNGIAYETGVRSKIKITKNKAIGKRREVTMTIYYDIGIDNIGDSIDYLVKHKVFSEAGRKIIAKELDFEGMLPNLINHIETNNLEDKLSKLVEKQWHKVEQALLTNRKRKY